MGSIVFLFFLETHLTDPVDVTFLFRDGRRVGPLGSQGEGRPGPQEQSFVCHGEEGVFSPSIPNTFFLGRTGCICGHFSRAFPLMCTFFIFWEHFLFSMHFFSPWLFFEFSWDNDFDLEKFCI